MKRLTHNFYLKDHLGSIRAILNGNNILVQSQDGVYPDFTGNVWGFLSRSWDTTSTRYKFTGKERDNESGYDYFGARYFNSRTAVWLSTDPLFEKHIQFTPYNYVLGNPMILIDPDGRIDVPEEYKNLYPKLYSYLENKFEKNVTGDTKIMNAFMESTGMLVEDTIKNLKFGQGPKLEILELGNEKAWNLPRLGHWDENTKTIQVDITYIKELEQSNNDELQVYTFLVQVIILHEGAHGAAEQTGPPYSEKEAGFVFEKSAFGTTIGSYNQAVRVLNFRNYESGKSKRYKEKEDGW